MAEPRTRESLARLFADVFETDLRGREVLEYLSKVYGKPAVTEGGIDAVLKTYYRLGQRDLLDHIHVQIARAHGADETGTTPEALTERTTS